MITANDMIKQSKIETGQRYLDVKTGLMLKVEEVLDASSFILEGRDRQHEYRMIVCPNHVSLSSRPIGNTRNFTGGLCGYNRRTGLNLVGVY